MGKPAGRCPPTSGWCFARPRYCPLLATARSAFPRSSVWPDAYVRCPHRLHRMHAAFALVRHQHDPANGAHEPCRICARSMWRAAMRSVCATESTEFRGVRHACQSVRWIVPPSERPMVLTVRVTMPGYAKPACRRHRQITVCLLVDERLKTFPRTKCSIQNTISDKAAPRWQTGCLARAAQALSARISEVLGCERQKVAHGVARSALRRGSLGLKRRLFCCAARVAMHARAAFAPCGAD